MHHQWKKETQPDPKQYQIAELVGKIITDQIGSSYNQIALPEEK
jgi:hypothetical protein